MKQIDEDLWQTTLENPFSNLNTHAYFLKHETGNVLFYNSSNANDLNEISSLGGIRFQYLSHRHETGDSLAIIKNKFNSELCADIEEQAAINKVCKVDITFSKRCFHNQNIEVIPTPGHTSGGLCFLYRTKNDKLYIFTGDTLFFSNGYLDTILISDDGADPVKLINSLTQLRELTPNVVISSASVGDVAYAELSKQQWLDALDKNIEKLSASKV